MRNRLLNDCLGAILVILATVAVSSAATYRVTVDCNHAAIQNEDTGNRITVSFLDINRNLIRSASRAGVRNCTRGDAVFSIETNRVVRFVEFSTNGNDAFYIDEWRIIRNGILIKREGLDNLRGWCLSTDPNDAGGPWRGYVTGGCRTRIRFPVASGSVVPVTGSYRVTVDCSHSAIQNEDTGNRITVSFLDANRNVIRRISRNGVRNCTSGDAAFSITTNRTVRYVEFSTNGNDAFYIDEWRLFRNGTLVTRQGTDNARGWCLSTDPKDASGPWQGFVSGGCRTRLRFPVPGTTTGPPASVTNYRVTIDCNHSAITNTDTGNRITVSFLDSGRRVIRSVSHNGIRNCARNEAGFSINTNRAVSYIQFSTNGNDAFFIDEWRLFRNGRLVKRTGADNARGWCLSTDPNDARGPWTGYVTGGCRTRIRFP